MKYEKRRRQSRKEVKSFVSSTKCISFDIQMAKLEKLKFTFLIEDQNGLLQGPQKIKNKFARTFALCNTFGHETQYISYVRAIIDLLSDPCHQENDFFL